MTGIVDSWTVKINTDGWWWILPSLNFPTRSLNEKKRGRKTIVFAIVVSSARSGFWEEPSVFERKRKNSIWDERPIAIDVCPQPEKTIPCQSLSDRHVCRCIIWHDRIQTCSSSVESLQKCALIYSFSCWPSTKKTCLCCFSSGSFLDGRYSFNLLELTSRRALRE